MKAIVTANGKTYGSKNMFDMINNYTNNSLKEKLEEAEEVSCAAYPGLLEEGVVFNTTVYGNGPAWSALAKAVQASCPREISEVQKWAHEVLEIDKHLKNAYNLDSMASKMVMGENGKVENASELLSQLMSQI